MEQTNEQEIDLKDLFFYVLHNWRIVLTTALILAVLVGGYKLGKGLLMQQNKDYIASIEMKYEEDEKDYEQKKNTLELSIQNLTANIQNAELYQANSILQKIDPYNKWVASADVFIKIDDTEKESKKNAYDSDPADSVLKAYESAIKKGIELQNFSKEKGLDLKYLKELIRVIPDYQSNMLTITVTNKDEAGAQEILSVILKSLNNKYPYVQQNLGGHSMVVMNQNLSTKADPDLAEAQKNKIESLTSTRQSLEDTERKLEELKEPQTPANISLKVIVKSGIKSVVLGGIVGGFLACFLACISFFLNNRVYKSGDLKIRFGIKNLGNFIRKREKRAFLKIDCLLDKLEGVEYVSDAAVYDRIVANIEIYTQKKQLILLTGTAGADDINKITANLRERLPDLRFESAGDMNKYPETLTKLLKADGIILVETVGVSKYNMIYNELETITSINKNIIGCIML
ncbi:MAG: hypothetical protein E7247_04010 [Paenibacillaceae bacterium]|nr:hypothetical protein [Paenibacillaceae bacterium]